MHSTKLPRALLLVAVTVAGSGTGTAACTTPTIDGTPAGPRLVPGQSQGPGGLGGGEGQDPDNPNLPPPQERLPDGGFAPPPPMMDGQAPPPPIGGPPDSDMDGVPDSFDCDPQSNKLGARIIEDDLATAKGLVAAAPGFDPAAWMHASGAYRQEALRDRADVSFLQVQADGPFALDVRAAATAIGTFNPKLRQDLVVFGAVSNGSAFAGYGCGVEVVEGYPNQMKASIVRLSGSLAAITTSPIKREDRQPLQVGEEFGIGVEVRGGAVLCTVTQATSRVVLGADVGAVGGGSVGFFTRQSKALFNRVRVCQITPSSP